jgi:hypothetical protein
VTVAGDVYELVVEWIDSAGTTKALNVFHFRQRGAPVLTAINLIAEFKANAQTQYRAMIASGFGIRRYAARSMIPYNTDFYETIENPTLTGTGGTTAVPAVCAGIITWRTGQPGRRKRGRSYLPGISINNTDFAGRLAAVFIANTVNAFGNQVMTRWGPTGASTTTEIGVWSRLNAGPDPPFDPAGFTPITAFTAQPALGSMGTRRFGRGM